MTLKDKILSFLYKYFTNIIIDIGIYKLYLKLTDSYAKRLLDSTNNFKEVEQLILKRTFYSKRGFILKNYKIHIIFNTVFNNYEVSIEESYLDSLENELIIKDYNTYSSINNKEDENNFKHFITVVMAITIAINTLYCNCANINVEINTLDNKSFKDCFLKSIERLKEDELYFPYIHVTEEIN